MNESMLINFYRIMIKLRFDIKRKENKDILCILIRAFEGLMNNKEMCNATVKIVPDWEAQLKYEEAEYYLIQKERIEFIKTAIHIMIDNLNTNKFDIVYDIADMLHVFPDIVIQQKKKHWRRCWRKYWKVYVEPFHKKWNCDTFVKYKKFFVSPLVELCC